MYNRVTNYVHKGIKQDRLRKSMIRKQSVVKDTVATEKNINIYNG